MNISENGLALLKRFEGCSLCAYRDCAGIWTIGWGITSADRSVTGKSVRPGLVISKATAELWLRKSVAQKYEPKVAQYDAVYHWNQNEFDALVCFAFNLGHIDQLTDHGRRSRGEIAAAWPLYCKAGGRVVQGLRERRAAELKLFLTPVGETVPANGEKTGTDKEKSGKNPYPAPTATVTSSAQAAEYHLEKWIPSGDAVRWVQWELKRLGYNLGKAGADGVCGQQTVGAIQTFQREAGLVPDGLCGPKTAAALSKAECRPTTKEKSDEKTDYRVRVAEQAKKIYPLCVGRRHGGGESKKVVSLDTLKRHKALSCNRMVSITLQEAGLLPKGVVVSHTKKRSGKKTIDDAVKHWRKLRHCKVIWVNKRYQDLPAAYRRAGVVYYQNSNACISAGNGKIWSCNKSVGHRYRGRGEYLRREGYPFSSRILVVVLPMEELGVECGE